MMDPIHERDHTLDLVFCTDQRGIGLVSGLEIQLAVLKAKVNTAAKYHLRGTHP